jgi:hypothetical protein
MDNRPVVQNKRRWWVFFGDAVDLGWVKPFTRQGWRHCFAMTTLATDVPLVINPTRLVMEVSMPLTETYAAVNLFKAHGYRCLVVTVDKPDYNLAKHCIINSCATVVAYSLGISTWAFTPRQLWRHLLKNGAVEVT